MPRYLGGANHPIKRLPAGALITDAMRDSVREGRLILIDGSVIAKLKVYVRYFGTSEFIFAFLAVRSEPNVIVDVRLFPEQEVSAGHCWAAGRACIQLFKDALRDDQVIVAEGHSHGFDGAKFSSWVDLDHLIGMPVRAVGWPEDYSDRIVGCLRAVADAETQDHRVGELAEVHDMDLDGDLATLFSLRLISAEALPADLRVELDWRRHGSIASTFATINGQVGAESGDGLHFPVLLQRHCAVCGRSHGDEQIHTDEVTICIRGDEVQSEEESLAALAECQNTIVHRFQPAQPLYGTTDPVALGTTAPQFNSSEDVRPADFRLSRHGQVWSIPADLMERLLAQSPELLRILYPGEAKS